MKTRIEKMLGAKGNALAPSREHMAWKFFAIVIGIAGPLFDLMLWLWPAIEPKYRAPEMTILSSVIAMVAYGIGVAVADCAHSPVFPARRSE